MHVGGLFRRLGGTSAHTDLARARANVAADGGLATARVDLDSRVAAGREGLTRLGAAARGSSFGAAAPLVPCPNSRCLRGSTSDRESPSNRADELAPRRSDDRTPHGTRPAFRRSSPAPQFCRGTPSPLRAEAKLGRVPRSGSTSTHSLSSARGAPSAAPSRHDAYPRVSSASSTGESSRSSSSCSSVRGASRRRPSPHRRAPHSALSSS